MLTRINSVSDYVDGDCPVGTSGAEHLATSSGSFAEYGGAYSDPRGSGDPAPSGGRKKNKPANKTKPPPQQQTAGTAKNQHNVVNGRYVTNRAGHSICPDYQTGACPGKGRCPHNNRVVHVCNRCLQVHAGDVAGETCNKNAPSQPSAGLKSKQQQTTGGKGKGKGKGKGRKTRKNGML